MGMYHDGHVHHVNYEYQDHLRNCEFTVSLADVPIRITCHYEGNRVFLEDYLTEEAPLAEVHPTGADLAFARRGLVEALEGDGRSGACISDIDIENQALFALITEKLVAFNTILFHGSALSMDGEAYIFTAPSGTGKSTFARHWRETFGKRVWMINDDKPFVRIDGGAARVYGSPWDGKHCLSRNASAPLKAVLRLFQSGENRLEPMHKADAYQVLLQQSYMSDVPDTACRILTLERELLDAAAFYRMYCNREAEAVMCAWRGMHAKQGEAVHMDDRNEGGDVPCG